MVLDLPRHSIVIRLFNWTQSFSGILLLFRGYFLLHTRLLGELIQKRQELGRKLIVLAIVVRFLVFQNLLCELSRQLVKLAFFFCRTRLFLLLWFLFLILYDRTLLGHFGTLNLWLNLWLVNFLYHTFVFCFLLSLLLFWGRNLFLLNFWLCNSDLDLGLF